MIGTILRRLLAACRVMAGRSPFPNHKHHQTDDAWIAKMQATLAEGYHLQHGFCPDCGAYSLSMVWPEYIGKLGECPQCHKVTTRPGSAIPKDTGDLSPAAMAKRPPMITLEQLAADLNNAAIYASVGAVTALWRNMAKRALQNYERD